MTKGRYSIKTDMTLTLIGTHDADSHTVTLDLTFDISPSYAQSMFDPGDAVTAEVISAKIGGEEVPDWLIAMIDTDEELQGCMVQEAWEHEQSAAEDAADYRREEQMIDKFNQSTGSGRGQ